MNEWLPIAAVEKRFGVCRRTIDRWMLTKGFPQPARLGRRYWDRAMVEEWALNVTYDVTYHRGKPKKSASLMLTKP